MSELSSPPPEHCPGVGSESAGKASACAGCPNQGICASNQTGGPDPDLPLIRQRLDNVKHKVIVLSGKGGVGKTTVTAMLAWSLTADPNKNVAVLDVDICGPSMPTVLGLLNEEVHQSGSGWSPVFVTENLAAMSIGFLLDGPDAAVIWRGPRKNGMIKQFLRDVDWGSTDYMLIDTPPGTSDEHLSITQYLRQCGVDGALIVTTPPEVSLADVRREITFCRKVNIPIIGVIENMSEFICPNCKKSSEIFPADTGGAEKMAAEMGVPFLGKLPLDPRIGQCCDSGKNYLEEEPGSPAVIAYKTIVDKIIEYCEQTVKTLVDTQGGGDAATS